MDVIRTMGAEWRIVMGGLFAGFGVLAIASASAAATYSGGPLTIFGEESARINIDISGLTGSFTSWVFTADFGGDRPNDNEFNLDVRTTLRTNDSLPFSLFLEDSNFDFVYDSNDILTITEDFGSNGNFSLDALVGGDYDNVRLDLFNDEASRLDIESWTLTFVPAPGAMGVLAMGGVLAARRRRG